MILSLLLLAAITAFAILEVRRFTRQRAAGEPTAFDYFRSVPPVHRWTGVAVTLGGAVLTLVVASAFGGGSQTTTETPSLVEFGIALSFFVAVVFGGDRIGAGAVEYAVGKPGSPKAKGSFLLLVVGLPVAMLVFVSVTSALYMALTFASFVLVHRAHLAGARDAIEAPGGGVMVDARLEQIAAARANTGNVVAYWLLTLSVIGLIGRTLELIG